jgi:cytochrome c-type biogenesis protein CcsB
MEIALLKAAAAFYLLATASFVLFLLLPTKAFFSRLSPLLILSGFVIQSGALVAHFVETGYPGFAHFRQAAQFYSWLLAGGYLLVQFKYRLTALGSLIAPLALFLTLAAFAAPGREPFPETLRTYWLPIHVTFALLGNAVFALAFGVSLMYLVQEYQLKQKKTRSFYRRLPSLETLDRLNSVLLVWGFPLMTLGILTGSLWAREHWGDYWTWESRQISSALTWFLYAGLLQGRITAGLRGRKAAALTILGFVVVLGYFLWGNAIFPSRHGGQFA